LTFLTNRYLFEYVEIAMSQRNEGMTLVAKTAKSLAELSLARGLGSFLGAEDELLEKFSVSRPTLRQAAKIVESDRLISIRRGAKGGFYAERPNAKDAIKSLARFLRLQGATIAHVHAATRLIVEEMGVSAAACTQSDLRDRMTQFRAQIDTNDTVADLVRAETDLALLLAQMSGNPASELFIEIGYTFGREDDQVAFYRNPADRERARALQRGLCDAVLSGDGEIARVMMRRRSDMVTEWLARADGRAT
jgi:GntR family transcriptional regulator, transcriptional repressor for pyruvate dehydrogenase complex